MPKTSFTPDGSAHNGAHDHSQQAGGVAVREPKPNHKKHRPSRHQVSLHGRIAVPPEPPKPPAEKPVMPPRGIFGRLRHVLDERIHLHDLRVRTLSVRPRGWKDFPPANAATLKQAVRITSSRFFNEHPLADLTVLSMLHLAALTVMHIAQLPGQAVKKKIEPLTEHLPKLPEPRHKPAVQPPSLLLKEEPVVARVAKQEAVNPAVLKQLQALGKKSGVAPAATIAAPTAPAVAARKLPLRAAIMVWLSPTARAMRHRARKLPATVVKNVAIKPHDKVTQHTTSILENVVLPTTVAPAKAKVEAKAEAKAKPKVERAPLLPIGWQRSLAGFAGIALVLVLPLGVYGSIGNINSFKDQLMGEGIGAVNLIKAGGEAAKNRDFASASRAFAQADENFSDAERQLGALATMLNAAPKLLPGTAISAAAPLLNAGREIAQGGERLSSGLQAADALSTPTEKINALKSYLSEALPHLERANDALALVTASALPAKYQGAVTDAQRDLPKLTNAVRKASAVADVMGSLLGEKEPKRYLMVFQNNAEIRPTGGFMGSFALVDVEKGKITNMQIPGGGTYDLKGSLTAKVASPQPLHLINPLWQFQDANWYPDFPTSAKQITWFYDKAHGPTTDGVIAFNATLMEDLLAVTGPIDMPEYGKTITNQNFYYETQKQVEVDYDKTENKPKQFIADLAPKVIDKLMHADNDQLVQLAGIMDEALAKRDVQLWLKNADDEQRITNLGWGGGIKKTDGDYLYMVHTNIAGQKTDLQMRDEVQHSVKILPDGTGIVTLTLSRTHGGQKGAMFSGVRNVDYVRFYVPQGSMLVEAHGFEAPDPKLFKLGDGTEGADPAVAAEEQNAKIDRDSGTRISDEGDKTVFGNWMQIDPGDTSVVTLVYQLPPGTVTLTHPPEGKLATFYGDIAGNRRDRMDYTLLVQKQSGSTPVNFTSSIDFPRGFSPSWQAPQRTTDDRGRWTVTAKIDRDAFFGSVAEGQ